MLNNALTFSNILANKAIQGFVFIYQRAIFAVIWVIRLIHETCRPVPDIIVTHTLIAY